MSTERGRDFGKIVRDHRLRLLPGCGHYDVWFRPGIETQEWAEDPNTSARHAEKLFEEMSSHCSRTRQEHVRDVVVVTADEGLWPGDLLLYSM